MGREKSLCHWKETLPLGSEGVLVAREGEEALPPGKKRTESFTEKSSVRWKMSYIKGMSREEKRFYHSYE